MATDSTRSHSNIAALLVILALSAVTMLWLFWRFPLATGVVTITVLAALGISARLARSIEQADIKDIRRDQQHV
jgi:membrane protein implicated in regulation of membrane protease activity